jgi:hypothetical protein
VPTLRACIEALQHDGFTQLRLAPGLPGADQPMRLIENCIANASALASLVGGKGSEYGGFTVVQDHRREIMVVQCDGQPVYETGTLVAGIWPSDPPPPSLDMHAVRHALGLGVELNMALPLSQINLTIHQAAAIAPTPKTVPKTVPRTFWAHLLDDDDPLNDEGEA